MNTEEQQLSDLLHRITPEPPRGVTVEDVAIRLADQAGRRGEPRRNRTFRGSSGFSRRGRAWAPVLAAASVFAVAGASAGIAALATSHHSRSPQAGRAVSTASASAVSTTPAASRPAASASPGRGSVIPGGPWGAELIDHQALLQGSLAGSGNSLYALTGQDLVRIDPATGGITQSTPYSSGMASPPVVLGNTVWVVWAYRGATVILHGYDARTLAEVASVSVPARGQLSAAALGVLAAGPDGRLYLAAGDSVALVNPASGAVVRRIEVGGTGPVNSVAVSPDGARLYVSTSVGRTFHLLAYDLADGVQVGTSTVPGGTAGNLVATSGGVWGTLGTGTGEWVWFARAGDLSSFSRVTQGGGGGLESLPTLADGAVWIGGSYTLACANPGTGRVLATAAVPADNGTAEYFASVTYAGGYAYSYYLNDQSQLQGLVRISPPAACMPGS